MRSFNDVFVEIMRKKREKAEGIERHPGGRPRKPLVLRDTSEIFEELRQRAFQVSRVGLVGEITAQSRNPHRRGRKARRLIG